MFLFHREIELPLHDNGMEPVEFLKSMGISLTPLSEVMVGGRSQRVFELLCTHLVTCISASVLSFESLYIHLQNFTSQHCSHKQKASLKSSSWAIKLIR